MATIHFQCGTCGQPLFADSSSTGQEVRCPNCQDPLLVPAADTGSVTLPPISNAAPAPSAHSAADLPRIDGYEIIGKLGEGGMGVVWRAIQLSTSRVVALKLLAPSALGSDQARARFAREVELSARLEHPNIARLYDSGLRQGVYFYAMELVKGRPLDEHVKEHALTEDELLQLMETICRAVDYAHQHGVIHTDLKHANVLVAADGQPRLLDFGLAKSTWVSDGASQLSISGLVAGTAGYMSPEQAAGDRRDLDARTDVYTLGVMLFELLTGQLPHDPHGGRHSLIRRIAEEEPRRPRAVKPDLDRQLEAILLKALAHDRDQRYASAAELAQDLANYRQRIPVTAKPPSALRKHRQLIAMAAGLAAVAALGAVAVHWLATLPVKTKPAKPTIVAPANIKAWTNSLGMKFVSVPGTDVRFSIWPTRVQDYQPFATATKCEWPKPFFEQGPTHPAVCVTWDAAQDFCAWLTAKERNEGLLRPDQFYRIPTDAEWSIAAGLGPETGGTPKEKSGRINDAYPWGKQWPPPRGAGNFGPSANADDYPYTSPVGSFAENRFGLFDMGGNVWQWCEERYGDDSNSRVLRGASWNRADFNSLLLSFRCSASAKHQCPREGFRCVLAQGQPSARAARSAPPLTRPAAENLAAVLHLALRAVNPSYDGHGRIGVADGRIVEVDLNGCVISDITPLRGLSLRSVELWQTPVRDLSPLAGMKLAKLNLGGCTGVKDISVLKGMPLEWLHMAGVRTTDLSALQDAPLVYLNMYGTPVSDLAPLRNSRLATLDAGYCLTLQDLSPLRGLPLRELHVNNTAVRDLTPLAEMKLVEVSVSDTLVTDLCPLAACPLARLRFTPRRIKSGINQIRAIRTLVQIEEGRSNGIGPAEDFWRQYDAR